MSAINDILLTPRFFLLSYFRIRLEKVCQAERILKVRKKSGNREKPVKGKKKKTKIKHERHLSLPKEKDKKTRTAIFFHNLIWSFVFFLSHGLSPLFPLSILSFRPFSLRRKRRQNSGRERNRM